MVLSSGNVVHNLRQIDWSKPDDGEAWARRFDDAVAEQMTEQSRRHSQDRRTSRLCAAPSRRRITSFRCCITAALAAEDGGAAAFLRGYAMGSLSMTCYGVGMEGLPCVEGEGAADIPTDVPADQTNI